MWSLIKSDEASFFKIILVKGGPGIFTKSYVTSRVLRAESLEGQRVLEGLCIYWNCRKVAFHQWAGQMNSLVLSCTSSCIYQVKYIVILPSSHFLTLPTPERNSLRFMVVTNQRIQSQLYGNWELFKSGFNFCLASSGQPPQMAERLFHGLTELWQEPLAGCREQILWEKIIKSKQC